VGKHVLFQLFAFPVLAAATQGTSHGAEPLVAPVLEIDWQEQIRVAGVWDRISFSLCISLWLIRAFITTQGPRR
jgi:hypothetical protein